MTPSKSTAKRKASGPISPPPVKQKVHTGTTKTAVASFFTPTSQKPKDRTVWTERSRNDDVPATLLVGRYEPEGTVDREPRRKIAAFDLDGTLITTSSGKKHASGATDWKWWHSQVPGRLRELYGEGYRVVILSNQAGLTLHFDANHKGPKASAQKRLADFKQKCSAVLSNLDLPTSVYAATERDIFRKPNAGMWKELCEDYDIEDVDLPNSVFVGDAGGRLASGDSPKDFSCSDRNLAHNVGISYKTPEEFFLGSPPRAFTRDLDLARFPFTEVAEHDRREDAGPVLDKINHQDIILFCGSPGAGKSTFFWNYVRPLGYERVNQDILRSRDKCVQAAVDFLDNDKSVAVDNTNANSDIRAVWIQLARKRDIPIRCIWFRTPPQVCEHNDAVRAQNKSFNPEARDLLPKAAFTGYASRFQVPKLDEGFQDIVEVPFVFRGSKEDYTLWGRYWV